MVSLYDIDARIRARGHYGKKTMPDAIARSLHTDPAKALVIRYIRHFVAEGFANWDVLDNGDIQVRFNTGETFLLAETVIIRLA